MAPDVVVRERPLSDAERAWLASRAEKDVAWAVARRDERVRGVVWLGVAVAAVLVALALLAVYGLESPGRAALVIVTGTLVAASAAWFDLREDFARVPAVRAQWRGFIAASEAGPVREMDITVRRGICVNESNWLLDAGAGWWVLIAPWWEDAFAPRSHVHWTTFASNLQRVSTDGAEIPLETRDVDDFDLPDDHPLNEKFGPVMFHADGDPVEGLRRFDQGSFPVGSSSVPS